MADQDIFPIRGTNPTQDVPAYGGSGIDGSTYAKHDPDCNLSTHLSENDWNFLLDNLRRLVVGCGIDITLVDVVNDPTLILRAVQQCVENGGNAAPQAFSDTFIVPENQMSILNFLANDGQDNRDSLHVSKINETPVVSGDTVAVANGSVRVRGDGLIEFTPTVDFTGVTGMLYEATDLSGLVTASVVTITVFDVPAPDPEPGLEIIEIRHASVSWAPPTWSQMTPFTPAELAAAIDGNTVNRAKQMLGAGNVNWLAFEVNIPIVLKKAIFHPAGQWTSGQYRATGPYFNFMLGSDDGETFGILDCNNVHSDRNSPHTTTINTNDQGGDMLSGGTYPSNANNWKTYKDASSQRVKFMKAFNYTDGAEVVDLSNIALET
jgi:hypothetical protein